MTPEEIEIERSRLKARIDAEPMKAQFHEELNAFELQHPAAQPALSDPLDDEEG